MAHCVWRRVRAGWEARKDEIDGEEGRRWEVVEEGDEQACAGNGAIAILCCSLVIAQVFWL